ncbi:hypothetical protein MSPP1_002234 [Malassezia sp. CBS 17886]|nr:hypothetical protein MSPP1_002234 [Malassezia sp. CBS 17886]
MEWNFGPYKQAKTALLQLSTSSHIFVIHLSRMDTIPAPLASLMRSPSILKVGVAIRNDALKLQRDFGLESRGLVELSKIAKIIHPDAWRHRPHLISLQDLCQTYMERTLVKDAVRTSSWTNVPLSPLQMEYAASDAYAGLELFHALLLLTASRDDAPRSAEERITALTELVDSVVADVVGAANMAASRKLALRTAREEVGKERRSADAAGAATASAAAPPPAEKSLLAHQVAFRAWLLEQRNFAEIAAQSTVKVGTVAGYVIKAIREMHSSIRRPGCQTAVPGWYGREYLRDWDADRRRRLRADLQHPEALRVTLYNANWLAYYGVFTGAELATLRSKAPHP